MPAIQILPKGMEQLAAKQFQTLANHMGLALPDQAAFLPDAMPALGDIQRSTSGHLAASQPAPVATGPPALADPSMTLSSQETQADSISCGTQESPAKPANPPEEPTPKRAKTDTSPHMLLEVAKRVYGPGPADPKRPSDAVTAPPLLDIAPVTTIPKGPPVVKAPSPKPSKLPEMPTTPKFKSFSWGGVSIYHGGPRSTYRCSEYPGSRNTKFFKNWGDLCDHIVST